MIVIRHFPAFPTRQTRRREGRGASAGGFRDSMQTPEHRGIGHEREESDLSARYPLTCPRFLRYRDLVIEQKAQQRDLHPLARRRHDQAQLRCRHP
jgi:hypothetical protein